MAIKLYKFRSLGNPIDFNRAKAILETGCFWCSQFSDLNDPMEGAFTTVVSGDCADEIVRVIYDKKKRYKICSFSSEKSFNAGFLRPLENPAMWGYYANAFKGIAIEIEVDESEVRKIDYVDSIQKLSDWADKGEIEKLLSAKFISWQHEAEYRFLIDDQRNFHEIGKITAIYFGEPYRGAHNKQSIYSDNKSLQEYEKLKEELILIAHKINCYSAAVERGKVVGQIVRRAQ